MPFKLCPEGVILGLLLCVLCNERCKYYLYLEGFFRVSTVMLERVRHHRHRIFLFIESFRASLAQGA